MSTHAHGQARVARSTRRARSVGPRRLPLSAWRRSSAPRRMRRSHRTSGERLRRGRGTLARCGWVERAASPVGALVCGLGSRGGCRPGAGREPSRWRDAVRLPVAPREVELEVRRARPRAPTRWSWAPGRARSGYQIRSWALSFERLDGSAPEADRLRYRRSSTAERRWRRAEWVPMRSGRRSHRIRSAFRQCVSEGGCVR